MKLGKKGAYTFPDQFRFMLPRRSVGSAIHAQLPILPSQARISCLIAKTLDDIAGIASEQKAEQEA
jgi:hypothetical protein